MPKKACGNLHYNSLATLETSSYRIQNTSLEKGKIGKSILLSIRQVHGAHTFFLCLLTQSHSNFTDKEAGALKQEVDSQGQGRHLCQEVTLRPVTVQLVFPVCQLLMEGWETGFGLPCVFPNSHGIEWAPSQCLAQIPQLHGIELGCDTDNVATQQAPPTVHVDSHPARPAP